MTKLRLSVWLPLRYATQQSSLTAVVGRKMRQMNAVLQLGNVAVLRNRHGHMQNDSEPFAIPGNINLAGRPRYLPCCVGHS